MPEADQGMAMGGSKDSDRLENEANKNKHINFWFCKITDFCEKYEWTKIALYKSHMRKYIWLIDWFYCI